MEMALKTDLAHSVRGTDGRLLCFALLPFFFLSEGMRRAVGGLKHDAAPVTQRSLVRRGQISSVDRDVIRVAGHIDAAVIRAAAPRGTPVATNVATKSL